MANEIQIDEVLAEALPPYTPHEALVEANRCLFCYDAPCTHACPTHIDIPRFIKKISTNNLLGSARTILEANLLGATCARVCPVQELCEGACVLGSEHKPIRIGRLQRYATDHVLNKNIDVFHPGAPTGKKVAVVGAGPAGLTCAGELAKAGHDVTIFEAPARRRTLHLRHHCLARAGRDRARRGRNGEAPRSETRNRRGVRLNQSLDEIRSQFSAVYLAIGLDISPMLGIPGEEHILDGLAYIEQSKMDPAGLKIGRDVVVIGAGNTAVDCATVAKRLGASRVTMVYRRTDQEMTAYPHEYDFVKKEGVEFRFLTQPTNVCIEEGRVKGLQCVRMELGDPDHSGRPAPRPTPGSEFTIEADQVVKSIGQNKPPLSAMLGVATEKGYIKVDDNFETSQPGIYAGGDCVRAKGSASTVMAVQDGKLAARAIDKKLRQH